MLEKINLITIEPNELIEVAEKTIEQYESKMNLGYTTYGGANLKDIQLLEQRLQRVRMTPKGQELYNKTVEILKDRGIIKDKKESNVLTTYEVYQNYYSNFSNNR